ncbi:MAG: RdgB/HAM1 family non-canonical purine NTP pyrophosphatase [Gammaproteobacteria bacterium]|jgi:XTP/dITP diphosphohydrolase
MMDIVLASNNSGKLAEMREMLSKEYYNIKTPAEFGLGSPEETGKTFVENSIIKARYASLHTGLPSIADDSGLCIPALNCEPGIFSARYAGRCATDADNVSHLLSKMAGLKETDRNAYFVCAMVYMQGADDATPLIVQETWSGEILVSPQGSEGFGYDPVFYIPEFDCSASELDSSVKNQVSHRAKAMRRLLNDLERSLEGSKF